MNVLFSLFSLFVPGADASPEKLITWRFLMGLWAVVSMAALAFLFSVTAKGSDVRELKAAVYIPTILQLHEQRCLTKNANLARHLTISINEYQKKYFDAAGTYLPLENCDAVLSRNRGSYETE